MWMYMCVDYEWGSWADEQVKRGTGKEQWDIAFRGGSKSMRQWVALLQVPSGDSPFF